MEVSRTSSQGVGGGTLTGGGGRKGRCGQRRLKGAPSASFKEVWPEEEHPSPLPVMARLLMHRASSPEWLDTLFEPHCRQQSSRELLFFTEVDLVAWVTLGLRLSLHAAAQVHGALKVSLQALYDKVHPTEPQVGWESVLSWPPFWAAESGRTAWGYQGSAPPSTQSVGPRKAPSLSGIGPSPLAQPPVRFPAVHTMRGVDLRENSACVDEERLARRQ